MIIEMLYDNNKKFYEWQPKNGEGYELTIRIKDNNKYKIEKVVGVIDDWINNRLYFRYGNRRP